MIALSGSAHVYLACGWCAWHAAHATAPARFDSRRASLVLGMTLALTSPWNIAFWLTVIGRPELTDQGAMALFAIVAAIIAGALVWGLVWSAIVVLLRRRTSPGGRWWAVGPRAATGALMLYFALTSARALLGLKCGGYTERREHHPR